MLKLTCSNGLQVNIMDEGQVAGRRSKVRPEEGDHDDYEDDEAIKRFEAENEQLRGLIGRLRGGT